MTNNLSALLAVLHDDPLDQSTRLVFADWCEENGHEWAAKPLREGRIPLFPEDVKAVHSLKNCSYAPASWPKKFAHDLPSEGSVTPRQYLFLWILLRKYRRSVHDESIRAEAEKRYQRYKALHEAGMVKPEFKPIAENDRTQEHFRKLRHTRKVNKSYKELEMPLFD